MDDLERLVAIQEIRDLIARYAIHYDDKDWAAFATLWTEDAAFVANGVAFAGRGPMLEFLTTCLPDDYAGKHMNSQSLIEVAPGVTAEQVQQMTEPKLTVKRPPQTIAV